MTAPAEKIAELKQLRDDAVRAALTVYPDPELAKVVTNAVLVGFAHGGWAGRLHDAATLIALREQDQQALLDSIASRRAREAADPDHQAALARHEARRAARAAAGAAA